jgi:hypothetical protein
LSQLTFTINFMRVFSRGEEVGQVVRSTICPFTFTLPL